MPKKEATEFTKELVNKVENSTLKVAVEKALLFLEKNELPPHWDRDSLFGHSVSSGNSDYDGELDSDVRFLLVLLYYVMTVVRNMKWNMIFLEFGRRTA